MFLVPVDVPVLINLQWRGFATAVDLPFFRRIVVGTAFCALPEHVQSAIIAHEYAHIRYGHVWERFKALVTFRIRHLKSLAHEQEFQADAYASVLGYRVGMLEFLMSRTRRDQPDLLHPTPQARIDRLKGKQ